MDLHVRRQYLPIQFVGFRLDALQYVLRLLAAEHQNHAFNRIVILLRNAELAQPRRVADRDLADVLHANRSALFAADNNVPDVFRVLTSPMPRT